MTSKAVNIRKQQVARVYAQALLGACEKTGESESVIEQLDSLVDEVFTQHPHLRGLLDSQRLNSDEKSGLIDRVFGGRASDRFLTFLKVLSQHGRLDCIAEVRSEAVRQLNELRGRVEVSVTTAQPIGEELQQQLVQRLQEKLQCEVYLRCDVDESLIGGLKVRVGDTVVDGSVRSQLQQMRAHAVQHAMEKIHSEEGARFASGFSTSS